MGAFTIKRLGLVLTASGLVAGATAARSFGGDDAPRLGRLFRFGSNSRSSDSPGVGKPATNAGSAPKPYTPGSPAVNPSTGPGSSLPAYGPLGANPPMATPTTSPGANSRISAQPRVSRAATEAEPLVTRVSIGRGDDGKQFCMFIEIFADGTVMDSEGVHHVHSDQLRPIAHLLQTGELAKLKGHCGGPATDFIEQIHMVTYDRYHGRLRATPFSFSGNPQGCDPSVRKLNEAIDALQMKLAGPPVTRSIGANEAAIAAPLPTPTAPLGNDGAQPPPLELAPDPVKP